MHCFFAGLSKKGLRKAVLRQAPFEYARVGYSETTCAFSFLTLERISRIFSR